MRSNQHVLVHNDSPMDGVCLEAKEHLADKSRARRKRLKSLAKARAKRAALAAARQESKRIALEAWEREAAEAARLRKQVRVMSWKQKIRKELADLQPRLDHLRELRRTLNVTADSAVEENTGSVDADSQSQLAPAKGKQRMESTDRS